MKKLFYFFLIFTNSISSQNKDFIKVTYAYLYNEEKFDERASKYGIKDSNEMTKNLVMTSLEAFKYFETNLTYELYYNDYKSVSFVTKSLIPDHFNEIQKTIIKEEQFPFYYTNFKDSVSYKNLIFQTKKYNIIIKQKEWNITSEQQTIHDYKCYKATLKANPNITAWFAPELNYNIGPYEFFGLPGLVMRLDNDLISLVCKSISFNEKYDLNLFTKPDGIEIEESNFIELLKKSRRIR
ncbi:MAG: GLPGLI family protein [Flavobacteriales bacterium]|nr:GLPGLI family protein [Flavobacteriales bacterium]